jgi:hypothetical protein
LDEAVYPPGRGEALSPIEGSAEDDDLKEGTVTEKETSAV